MKKIICVSASNVSTARGHSASKKVAQLIEDYLEKYYDPERYQLEIIELINYTLTPCQMCEKCMPANMCPDNPDLNILSQKIMQADGLLFVIPHYAPIPSKLIILFEKLEEMFYLNYCKDNNFKNPLTNKAAAIIGHGGMIGDYEKLYLDNLITPVKNVLTSLGLKVVKAKNQSGVIFGVKGFRMSEDTIAPNIEHDWAMIKEIIKPLVTSLMEELQ